MESYWKLSFFIWLILSSFATLGIGLLLPDPLFSTIPLLLSGSFCFFFPGFLIFGLLFRCIANYWRDPVAQSWAVFSLYSVIATWLMFGFADELDFYTFFFGPGVMMFFMTSTLLGMYFFRPSKNVRSPSNPVEMIEPRVERLLPLPTSFFEESALLKCTKA